METININITAEQQEALERRTEFGGVQDAAQAGFDSILLMTVLSIQKERGSNLINFLKDNPDVAKNIQTKHNLDDNFQQIK